MLTEREGALKYFNRNDVSQAGQYPAFLWGLVGVGRGHAVLPWPQPPSCSFRGPSVHCCPNPGDTPAHRSIAAPGAGLFRAMLGQNGKHSLVGAPGPEWQGTGCCQRSPPSKHMLRRPWAPQASCGKGQRVLKLAKSLPPRPAPGQNVARRGSP